MKAIYIYKNTYENGYIYIGSHSWNGPRGVLDPSYHGSSRVAKFYRWAPVTEELIADITLCDNKYRTEKEYIEKYAAEYGVAPLTKAMSTYKGWCSRFKDGILLNGHANDMTNAQTVEVRRKIYESRKKTGYDTAIKAMHQEDVEKRKWETYKRNGNKPWAATKASHTPEALKKMTETNKRNARGFYINGKEYKLWDSETLCTMLDCSPRTIYRLWDRVQKEGVISYNCYVIKKEL